MTQELEKQKLLDAIKEEGYRWDAEKKVLEKLEKEKFDIANLKPFDKVLTRDSNRERWSASIFSHTWKDRYFCVSGWYKQCIPYTSNEHLLGATDDCDEYYKTW